MNSETDFTEEEIFGNFSGHLLSMEMELQNCSEGLTESDVRSVIRQAKDLGARKIVVSVENTPDHPEYEPELSFVRSLGMEAEIAPHRECPPSSAWTKCFRYLYSCVVKNNGDVNPCAGIALKIGNVLEQPLSEILRESLVLKRLHDWRKWVKDPCKSCREFSHCCGCRGAAWQFTNGDYLAADPVCRKNSDKLAQIKKLPVPIEDLLPHRPPVNICGFLCRINNMGGDICVDLNRTPLFHDADGYIYSELLPEIAAQSVAAADTFLRDGTIIPGLLTGLNHCRIVRKVRSDETVTVRFENTDELIPWHMLSFQIIGADGLLIAEGELKICTPED